MRRNVLIWTSVVVLLAATAWIVVAPWQLIRYPTNLDETLHYTGTVAIPVTPGASSEVRQPLSITRHIRVVKSTFDKVWIRETITNHLGSDVRVQENGYILDRRTMKPVAGDGNFAFTPSNKVTRSGAYAQPQFPMHVASSGAYKVWSDDTASVFDALSSGDHAKSGKLDLIVLRAHAAPHPVTAAYREFLGLPATTTLADAAKLANVDLNTVMQSLAGVLPASAMAQLVSLTTEPLPLAYQLESTGTVGVEPLTGGVVQVNDIGNRLTVSPELAELHLRTVLADYALDPTVRTVLDKFDELATRPPVTAMALSYSETPASERAAAHAAADLRNKARLVTIWVPAWASMGALVLIGAAIALSRRNEAVPADAHPATHHWWQHRAA